MDIGSEMDAVPVGLEVNRIEAGAVLGSTVLRVDGKSVLIGYDGGGEGWWPLSSLGLDRTLVPEMPVVGATVTRPEDRDATEATVLETDGENVLIAYNEGGEGWWPISVLAAEAEQISEPN